MIDLNKNQLLPEMKKSGNYVIEITLTTNGMAKINLVS